MFGEWCESLCRSGVRAGGININSRAVRMNGALAGTLSEFVILIVLKNIWSADLYWPGEWVFTCTYTGRCIKQMRIHTSTGFKLFLNLHMNNGWRSLSHYPRLQIIHYIKTNNTTLLYYMIPIIYYYKYILKGLSIHVSSVLSTGMRCIQHGSFSKSYKYNTVE